MHLDDVLPLHLATFTFPSWQEPFAGQTGHVLGFAIRHPSGIVLFDTGIGVGSALVDEHFRPVRLALADALARHGHDLGDVTAIANSHLHFDHCGNNALFPGVPIYAQTRELELARAPRYTVSEWIDFDGAAYHPVDGEAIMAAGVRIVATPGHTAGHQSLVVDTADGVVVLAGQAVYTRAELDHIASTGSLVGDDPPPEPEQYLESARRLIALRPRRVHFSHDRAVWDAPSDDH